MHSFEELFFNSLIHRQRQPGNLKTELDLAEDYFGRISPTSLDSSQLSDLIFLVVKSSANDQVIYIYFVLSCFLSFLGDTVGIVIILPDECFKVRRWTKLGSGAGCFLGGTRKPKLNNSPNSRRDSDRWEKISHFDSTNLPLLFNNRVSRNMVR